MDNQDIKNIFINYHHKIGHNGDLINKVLHWALIKTVLYLRSNTPLKAVLFQAANITGDSQWWNQQWEEGLSALLEEINSPHMEITIVSKCHSMVYKLHWPIKISLSYEWKTGLRSKNKGHIFRSWR